MDCLSDEDLLSLNHQGLIPGPKETEGDFLARSHYCLNLKANLSLNTNQDLLYNLPFVKFDSPIESLPTDSLETITSLFDIHPSWVPLFFDNKGLSFWEGGCTWIFQPKMKKVTGAFLQLQASFRKHPFYLYLYSRQELIAHELAHVGRMSFEEPRFEEALAYQTSASTFRKKSGALIQNPWESRLLVFILILILIGDLMTSTLFPSYFFSFQFFKILPLTLIASALFRLYQVQLELFNCLTQLITVTSSQKIAHAILYRLTDNEIMALGKMSSAQIQNYATKNSRQSLRWRLIHLAYFKRAF